MKSLIYVVSVALLVIVCAGGVRAQAIETVGGPYTPDSATVMLLHFDGDLNNAAAVQGKTAAAAVGHSTNPAKIFFIPNAGVTGMGQCVRLDNGAITDSTYLTLADTPAVDLQGSWTIEAWANIFSFGDNALDYRWVPRVVMKPGDNIFYEPNYWLEMWGDNRLFHAGFMTTSKGYVSVTSENNMFIPGQWVHLTFIRDTTRGIIAQMVHDVNKKLLSFTSAGFDPAGDPPQTNSNPVHMGWAGALSNAAPSTDSWLDGFLDEIRISNSVRNFAGPPLVTNITQLPNQPSTAASYSISAKAQPFNNGGSIVSTQLHYYTTKWDSVAMTGTGVDFSGVIPGQPFGTRIRYYVSATDNQGLRSVVPITAEVADTTRQAFYQFWIFEPNVELLNITFEEGPGNLPIDHSPAHQPLITYRVPDYSTDAKEGLYSMNLLNGTSAPGNLDSNWIEVESPFLAGEEFSLDFWMNADSALHATRIIHYPSQAGDWNNNNYEVSLRNNAKSLPAITARYMAPARGGQVVLQDTNGIVLGKWYHVIYERKKATNTAALMIRDENDSPYYFKALVDSTPIMGSSVAPARLRIGRGYTDVSPNEWFIAPFRGKLDNILLYNYPKTGITDVKEQFEAGVPLAFELSQNYPNPFNPSTRIEFVVPKLQRVSLTVYDLLGRKVKTLVNEDMHAGSHWVTWNGTNDRGHMVASGVYFYRLIAGNMSKVQKMMMMK